MLILGEVPGARLQLPQPHPCHLIQPVLTPVERETPWRAWALYPPLTILNNSQGLALGPPKANMG